MANDDPAWAYGSEKAQAAALGALGGPRQFSTVQAVLLGRGGEDWVWMDLLPSGVKAGARVGCLVCCPSGFAYAETLREETKGMFGTRERLSTWPLTLRKSDIAAVDLQTLVRSPVGGYSALTITTSAGAKLTFGLDLDNFDYPLTSLVVRELTGTHLPTGSGGFGEIRDDGAYVGARLNNGRWPVLVIDTANQRLCDLLFNSPDGAWRACRDLPEKRQWKSYQLGADGVITAEGWGPITLAGNRVSMQDPSFVGESGLPLVSKKYYERVFVPASVLEETWRDPQAVRTSRPGHVEVAGGSLRVAGYQAHDPAFDFTNRVRRLFAERMQTSEEGEQFQSIYRQSSEGTMFSNSPGADAATIANDAARYDGWVVYIFEGEHDGRPAAIARGYSADRTIAVAFAQPVTKRMLRYRLDGPMVTLATPPPLAKPSTR
ncbi:MAG: hypothetical protein IPL07_06215 [Acidimicrobiaceae bacterium]|nr:hypothetical protein [Acidimicrobiaceae bacterium]